MKTWNFKVKSNPQEIIKKLDSEFGSVGGMIFNTHHDKNDSVAFKVRKRLQDGYAALHDNQTIAHGKMLMTDVENETYIEITFTQHFLRILYVSIYLVSGLIAIILGITISATIFIVTGILLAVGIAILMQARNKFEKDIQQYKTLISEILELSKV
jgi:hypothetical protein